MKRCPVCGSSRIIKLKDSFYCKSCKYTNKKIESKEECILTEAMDKCECEFCKMNRQMRDISIKQIIRRYDLAIKKGEAILI